MQSRLNQAFVTLLIIATAYAIIFAPLEDSAAIVVAMLCAGAGMGGLSLLRDERERGILMRLFLGAYALRVLFAIVLYKTGLSATFAGGDDSVWLLGWMNSRFWRGWSVMPITGPYGYPESDFPKSLFDVYTTNLRNNVGYHYFASLFYFLLDVRSQMALAFFNCMAGALTTVMTWKVAREFFSEKASTFAGWAAAVLPALLIWSALTIKESWVILFQIVAFFAVYRCSRRFNPVYALLVLGLTVLSLGFRFYVAWFMVGSIIIAFACFRSRNPGRTAFTGLVGVVVLFTALSAAGVVKFDVLSILQSQLKEFNSFRTAVSGGLTSGPSGSYGTSGTGSGVKLDYDVTTPGGAAMMLMVGATYLLLSPFPWQVNSVRQALALPDVMVWYYLLFCFVLPGIAYSWRTHKALLLSLLAFMLPLILFYSITFGNVGLVYRQRAQLMPFLFVLAAAGYDKRQRLASRRSSANKKAMPLYLSPSPVRAAQAD